MSNAKNTIFFLSATLLVAYIFAAPNMVLASPPAIPLPNIPTPQSNFSCASLNGLTQEQTKTVKLEDIQYCIGEGYAPPRSWLKAPGGVNDAEGSSASLSAKCPPRPRKCEGFLKRGGGTAAPAFNPNFIPRTNPNLNIPPYPTPTNGRVRLPCGGSVALDINKLISQGGQFINNVKMNNIGGAVNTGVQIASGLLSPCSGGIMGIIQGAINLVMPAGCNMNIINGVTASCNGSVLSLPAGVTMSMNTNGQLTLPNGGSFLDAFNTTISIPGNSTVTVTGTSPNMIVTVTDQSGAAVTYNAGNVPSVEITPAGTVLIPNGTNLPLGAGSATIPASLP